ncbi:MAG: hypothetical protein RBS34_14290 [Desulfofustis sp.]|jgi:hypothetical protein|nr:hypothetical protein [Desulfofustis sp.]
MDLSLNLMTDFTVIGSPTDTTPQAVVDGAEQIIDGTEDIYDGSL